jgi:hypothetical protein
MRLLGIFSRLVFHVCPHEPEWYWRIRTIGVSRQSS